MDYPNRVVKKGESDKKIVTALQEKLNELGCGPIDVDGDYGTNTFKAVKLFQARNVDQNGNALEIDGQVGSLSWSAIFGAQSVPKVTVENTTNELLTEVMNIAIGQEGIRETPGKQNQGPEVNQYLASVDLGPGNAWCMAFVYWCFNKATDKLGRKNPTVKTGGCLLHWNGTTAKRVSQNEAMNNPSLVKPGQIFIMDFGGGLGHTGLVKEVNGGFIITIEGNTDPAGSRNGYGVFERTRKIKNINKGFIEYK